MPHPTQLNTNHTTNQPWVSNTQMMALVVEVAELQSLKVRDRQTEHKTSVRTYSKNAVGEHFNGPGHSLADMNILAIEKVFTPGHRNVEKRESLWINKLEAHFQGLNRKK